jgi:hypothetical protein
MSARDGERRVSARVANNDVGVVALAKYLSDRSEHRG